MSAARPTPDRSHAPARPRRRGPGGRRRAGLVPAAGWRLGGGRARAGSTARRRPRVAAPTGHRRAGRGAAGPPAPRAPGLRPVPADPDARFNTAGDAAVAIALAGTLFFQVPTGEARGQVALFLGLTMLPFAIVAPLIGPFLDRFSHGRRWAIGATMATRGFLCWVLADAVVDQSAWLFPAALGVLVASKAYGVTRAAAVPRLLPARLHAGQGQRPGLDVGHGRGGGLGADRRPGLDWSGPSGCCATRSCSSWSRRAAIRLPARSTPAQGEEQLVLRASDPRGRPGRRRTRIPPAVAFALRANCGPRWLSGFLIMFMAFLLRENPIGGWSPQVLPAIVVGAAGAGNFLGVVAASVLKRINPAVTVSLVLLADVGRGAAGRAVLRRARGRGARPGRRARPGAGEVLARRHDPARRPAPRAGQRVRPQRHHAPAGVGDRRLRRHRAAAGPARLGLGVAAVVLARLVGLRAAQPARPPVAA